MWLCKNTIKISLNLHCTVLVIVLKMGRTSKSISCLPWVYRETHSSKLWFPTHFLNGGRHQTMCVLEWHWCGCWARLMGQQSNPMGFGQQEQWQSRAIRAKSPTDCATALTHTKCHLSLTPRCNPPTEQTGQHQFYLQSQPSYCFSWEQSFLFVSLWICKKSTLSTTS